MKFKRIITTIIGLCLTIISVNAEEVTFGAPSGMAFEPLMLNQSEVVFKQASTKVDAIDPVLSASYFPGGRGANKLIIYTPNFGIHTGTNEFGTEAIVTGNIVTSLSGADSTIPANGLVISGHGVAKNWITQNVTVGSKVYVDTENNKITVYTTSDSFSYEAKSKIFEAQSMIDYYKSRMLNYKPEQAENHIQVAENYLKIAESETKNSVVLKQYTQEAIDEANMAIKTSLPYIDNELKGVWIRPTETSKEQIISTLDNLKANGFNSIFLETYFHGKTIFPSQVMNKYGFTVQNEIFQGFDPLDVWIKEAHKRGIKVHTWFQSFYVGNQPPESNPSSILAVRPDWGNKTKQYSSSTRPTKSISEHNGYFLDPANPEVQDFLEELIKESETDEAEAIDYLINNRKTLKNIAEYTNKVSTLTESVKNKRIFKSEDALSESLNISDLLNMINESVSGLGKEEANAVKDLTLISLSGQDGKEIYETYKNKCKDILEEAVKNEEALETRSRFQRMLGQINERNYNKSTLNEDVLNFARLYATLKENE